MNPKAEEITAPSPATVAALAQICTTEFQKCLDKAATIHPRELALVEDQLARFLVWTANIKVFAPGRESLDHRLREAPDVQDIIVGLLEGLEYRIQNTRRHLKPLSPSEAGRVLPPLNDKLQQAVQGISDEIGLLHRFSNTIRKASRETHNQKASDGFLIQDEEGNDTEPLLRQVFEHHIRDCFPGITDNIRQRLVDTMILRRKRILYRRARYGKTAIRPQEIPSQPLIARPEAATIVAHEQKQEPIRRVVKGTANNPRAQSAVLSTTQTATTLAPERFRKAATPSVISVSKTATLDDQEEPLLFPPVPYGGVLREYNKLKAKKEASHSAYMKSLPRRGLYQAQITARKSALKEELKQLWDDCLAGIGEMTCPFCFYMLPGRDVVDEKKWKSHVLLDLDPYVCLFETCETANNLYSHSRAWFQHMREHTLVWRCASKSHGEFIASTREDYLSHMEAAHAGKFNSTQLGVLADRNARTVGPLFKSCPLCGIEEVKGDKTMEDHVIRHLRILALHSLPSYEVDVGEMFDDTGSDQNTLTASRPRSRSTINLYQNSHEENQDNDDYDQKVQDLMSRMEETLEGLEELEIVPDMPEGENLRLLQWGFIAALHGSSEDPSKDPILQSFHNYLPQVQGYYPKCAICETPATTETLECGCEEQAVGKTAQKAEDRIMSPIFNDIRNWVSSRSWDFIQAERRRLVDSTPTPSKTSPTEEEERSGVEARGFQKGGDNNMEEMSSEQRVDEEEKVVGLQPQNAEDGGEATGSAKPSQQQDPGPTAAHRKDSEAGESFDRFLESQSPLLLQQPTKLIEVAQYFYSLVELSLPPDDDPSVRSPPLSPHLPGTRRNIKVVDDHSSEESVGSDSSESSRRLTPESTAVNDKNVEKSAGHDGKELLRLWGPSPTSITSQTQQQQSPDLLAPNFGDSDFTIFPPTSGEPQFNSSLFAADTQQRFPSQDTNMMTQPTHNPTPPHLLNPDPYQPGSANHSPCFNQHQFSVAPGKHSKITLLGPEAALLPGQIDWTHADPQFQGHRRTPLEFSDMSSAAPSPNLASSDTPGPIDQSHSPQLFTAVINDQGKESAPYDRKRHLRQLGKSV